MMMALLILLMLPPDCKLIRSGQNVLEMINGHKRLKVMKAIKLRGEIFTIFVKLHGAACIMT